LLATWDRSTRTRTFSEISIVRKRSEMPVTRPISPPEVMTSSPFWMASSILWCSLAFFCCGRMSRK